MKTSKLALILSLGLAGCSSNILCREQSKKPIDYNEMEREIEKSVQTIEPSKYGLYDLVDGCKGDLLMRDLKTSLNSLRLTEKDLLLLFIGAGHVNSARIALSEDFNMWFFSEAPSNNNFLLAQYARKVYPEKKRKKLFCIIYGDDHSRDFDFFSYFPDAEDLRRAGFERVLFAYEKIGRLGKIEEFDDDNMRNISCYISSLRESKLEVNMLRIDAY